MKTYPYTENGETIELVKKSEHDAVVAEHVGVANQNVVTFTNQVEKLRADNAELLARLEERTQSHLHASARDVQTIQRQSVLLDKLRKAAANAGCLEWFLAAYESAKSGEPAYVEIRIFENNDGWPRRGNLPDPLAEAVKRMEAVPIRDLGILYLKGGAGHYTNEGLGFLRAHLISAAKGEQP